LRHDKNGGAWCPKRMVTQEAVEYLEVNLHTMHVLTSVQTQGRFGNGMGQEYAEVYKLEYWRPGFNTLWARWKDRSGKQYRKVMASARHLITYKLLSSFSFCVIKLFIQY
ncbi:hypothetical protein L9F63_003295, partial [Diploptera punctata]